MKNKILLNYLPPAETNMPSAALSIIKSFLQSEGYNVEIKYWNLLINKLLLVNDSNNTASSQENLIPFCYIISEKYKNIEVINKIKSNLRALKPSWILKGNDIYNEWLDETKTKIFQIINTELDKIDFDNILIFGISSKFYQWIPGIILAEEIKKRNPATKIIIGGFESSYGAAEILEICPHIDFAVWGEGEYPLLELCKQIESGKLEFENISRLVYRESEIIKTSSNPRSKYLDFENYTLPDYSDYVEQFGENPTRLPINSIRGCSWKQCKFCNYSHGYKYRERSPKSILNEIKLMKNKYGTDNFIFVDNDIIGLDIERFKKLLDVIIDFNSKENTYLTLWGEFIIHHKLNFEILKKMFLAGFSQVGAGYEAISESILKKMNKNNGLAHNILLIKGLQKAGIKCPVNLIKGIPDESVEDVIESINNLHFFRFFYSDLKFPVNHLLGFFNLKKEAKYFNLLSEIQRNEYNNNSIAINLPPDFIKNKFNLFGYNKNAVANEKFWQYFSNVEQHYKNNKYSYNSQNLNGVYYFTEYCNEILINRITFDEQEYINTLKFCNDIVRSYDELYNYLKSKYPEIEKEKVIEILQNLKSAFLLYYNDDYLTIISIIDIDNC